MPAVEGIAIGAATVGAYAAISECRHKPAFRLTAHPARETIAPGAVARYRITIHPRSLADVAVHQYTGSCPVTVPGLTSLALAQAGIAEALWPQVEILDRPLDQDGCQGATITLSYTGSGTTS